MTHRTKQNRTGSFESCDPPPPHPPRKRRPEGSFDSARRSWSGGCELQDILTHAVFVLDKSSDPYHSWISQYISCCKRHFGSHSRVRGSEDWWSPPDQLETPADSDFAIFPLRLGVDEPGSVRGTTAICRCPQWVKNSNS